MTGGCVARIVPSSGIVTLASASSSSRNASKSSSARSISSISSTAGPRAGMLERAQQRPADQIVGTEQLLFAERRAAGLGEPDAQQLARVVPLVERLGRVDPLVALQADQRRVRARPPATWRPRSCRHPASPSSSSGCGRRRLRNIDVARPSSTR